MPQISTTITDDLIKNLQNIAKNSRKSFSKVTSDMIELGLETYENKQNKAAQNTSDLTDKHSEYLLRLLNINAEILKKTYGIKSQYKTDNPTLILQKIEDNVKAFIEKYLKNKQ
jgi:viroplasmin and RNaseH domain-containing protein